MAMYKIPAHLRVHEWYGPHLAWRGFGVDFKPRRAYLVNANLGGVNLKNAHLTDANLDGVNLNSAHLEGANMRGVNLKGANMKGAHLEDANLDGANLKGANLKGANLEGANLEGAHLDFSSGFPLWCGSFGIITDYQQECQQAYHTLRRSPAMEQMTEEQRERLRVARAALVELANDWDGIERRCLPEIENGDRGGAVKINNDAEYTSALARAEELMDELTDIGPDPDDEAELIELADAIAAWEEERWFCASEPGDLTEPPGVV